MLASTLRPAFMVHDLIGYYSLMTSVGFSATVNACFLAPGRHAYPAVSSAALGH